MSRLHPRLVGAGLFAIVACRDGRDVPPVAPPPPDAPVQKEEAPAAAGRGTPEAGDEATGGPKKDTPGAAPERVTVTDFEADAPDGPSSAFEAVIGDWYIGDAGGQKGLWVDGTRWRQGTPSASLADQAKRLYGERYAEFLDNVKAFAFYPLAVFTGDVPEGDIRISVRFYPESGRIDQAAGIVWNVTADGRYWGTRANPLEDNLLFFDVRRGKRKVRDTVRNVPTPTHEWHTLAVTLAGGECRVELDGREQLVGKLDTPRTGKVGLWSKADSKVLFDDFTIEPVR